MTSPVFTPAPEASHSSTLLWCDLLSQLAWETEHLLGSALESLELMHRDSRETPPALRALRRCLEQARQAGTAGRQIAQLVERRAGGAIPGEVSLADALSAALAPRMAALRSAGVQVIRALPQVKVQAELSLVGMLSRALVAWAQARAEGQFELRIEPPSAPGGRALLCCRVRHDDDAPRPTRFSGAAHWGAQWQLVRHAALALGWEMRSGETAGHSWLHLEVPCVQPQPQPQLQPQLEAIDMGADTHALEGCSVLLVSPEASLRVEVSKALRPLDVKLDFVDSAQEAALLCAEGGAGPDAVLLDGERVSEPAAWLRECMRTEEGVPTVIEIAAGDEFDVDPPDSAHIGRVGRRTLAGALPAALVLSVPYREHGRALHLS